MVLDDELRQHWNAHPQWQKQENRAAREATLPALRALIESFRSGALDLTEFRRRIDSQSKQRETGVWGFRGNAGVMFFTMLWKGAAEELAPLLRTVIALPPDDAGAREAIDQLRALARATKAHTGNRNIHEKFAPFFLSFFWEAQDREQWPMFHPASREGLDRLGLASLPEDVSEAYLAFRHAMQQACGTVGADVWDLEQFLWCFKHASPTPGGDAPPAPADTQPATGADDFYAALADSGLTFPDSLVTTMVLSLLAKRFVILAGISGTGKTQLPLQLARYLSAKGPAATVPEPTPESDERTLYLEVTPSTLKYGVLTLPRRFIGFIDLPERGAGADFSIRLPTGRDASVRLQNVGFTDESVQHARLNVRGLAKTWVTETAQPGDIVQVALDDQGRPVSLEHRPRTVQTATEPVRRHELIAVRSDWTDPRGLIGYWNPLTERYSTTPLIQLCLRAADDPAHPYLVILDEMNLARVEYYFSDFLSALESSEPIPLFDPTFEETETEVPASLPIPDNVLFIGTVNVDETTHAFSPKVLDRANVLEFDEVDLAGHLGLSEPSPSVAFRLSDGHLDPSLLAQRPAPDDAAQATVLEDSELTADLLRIHSLLEGARRHFGYRVLNELMAYLGHAVQRVDGNADHVARVALDHQLLQKVLPKLTGGRELQATLTQLLDVCVHGETTAAPSTTESLGEAAAALGGETDAVSPGLSAARYPRSAEKLRHMVQRLGHTGYVTFLE